MEHGQLSHVCLPLGMGVCVIGSSLRRVLLKTTQKLSPLALIKPMYHFVVSIITHLSFSLVAS